ncbi:sodium-dependent transporter [Pseudoflavonifractor sp. 60]|uniref:sodium-dependent transporter n=1 Tax=Pseudoflavonifractor sp. 60 TaxID=2304576 RepID=UPI001367BF39|nr:sodium-dependent transporter [Pseudoflavonifractor sp. 60]NBI66953.1 sodium-dependent transporter [Pseudoflavonifractor sp. 60]
MGAEKKKHQFTSGWGFVLSAVGSAVGMANVWGFPSKMGSYGGGAFLLAYLFFIMLFGTVGLSAEYAAGRRAHTGTLGAYRMAWSSRKKELGSAGATLGWLPLAGSMCIAIGYAVIIAYVLKAFAASAVGSLMTADTSVWFDSFSLADYSVVPFHVIVVVGTLLTLLLGARSIERTNKVMMPLFFLIFLILAVRVAFLPGAAEGYKYMFTPRWEDLLDPMVWIWAMGQAFFSLSITGSGMIVYGAYLGKDEDVVSLAKQTALFDTIAALVAALVIIPACFAYGLDVGAGPSLLFVTLPRILQDIPLGRLFAIILYTAMVFAGVSSLQNMFEAVGESLLHRFPKLNRKAMLGLLCIICLGIGLNMEPIFKWGPWMDIVSIYIIPIGATLGAVSWFWMMRREELLEEINRGAKKPSGQVWYSLGRYLYVPCAVILCCVALFLKVAF